MENSLIVETTHGKVRGYSRRGVIKFKGIPYATPPVGNLRFKPPAPIKPWKGIRDATEYSPVAPQPPSTLENMFTDPLPQSEADCLTLNIWTKSLTGDLQPVMFFIHGGAFITGSGRALDGARLVLRGDVVVVSINYRLGHLGFLYMPDIPDASANVGLLDMVAALKWVKNNISFFGGNPENITIFGESAGAFAVSSLLAMPYAKGLFHKAIVQSGYVSKFNLNTAYGLKVYEKLIKKLGIKKGDVDSLRKLSVEKFILPVETTSQVGGSYIRPVVDNDTLPEHPFEAISNGFSKNVELFIGSNLDENKIFSMLLTPYAFEPTEETLNRIMERIMVFTRQDKSKTKEMIEIYRKSKSTPREIIDAIMTDFTFRIPSIRLAEAQSKHQRNTFMYLFSWKSLFEGGKYGAMHGLELSFVFGILLDRDIGIYPRKTEETLKLSEKMMDAWISFARSGNPNHKNIPELPPYNLEKRATIIFDKKITVEEDPYGDERVVWDDIL